MSDANADAAKVEQWLRDLQLTHPDLHAIAQAVRVVVHAVARPASERVMYGGIMFHAPERACGVFAYAAHVTVEFGRGAEMVDAHGMLEGNGKFRRHVRLRAPADIETKHLQDYIAQAHRLSATPSQ